MNTSLHLRGCWFIFICSLLLNLPLTARTIYVDASATGSTNGNSWTHAYTDLQAALADARGNSNNLEIWVAAGTYRPASWDRTVAFELVANVPVYGGFAGNESNREDRDPVANPTILSGDIGVSGNTIDNSYHVVAMLQSAQESMLLDGFQIVGGNADGAVGNQGKGGGLFIHANINQDTFRLRIDNCEFFDNQATQGGAMACLVEGGAVLLDTIEGGNFHDNQATDGGAIYQYRGIGSQILAFVKNCFFVDNTATGNGGAIIHKGNMGTFGTLLAPTLTVLNGVFSRNISNRGSCLFLNDLYQTVTIIRNSTCYNNVASIDGHVFFTTDNNFVYFQNSIAWLYSSDPFGFFGFLSEADHIFLSNSIIEGGGHLPNNIIDENPDFLDPANDDFQLDICSPAIDQGISYGTATGKDINGNDRVYNNQVDLGATEFNATHIGLLPADGANMNLNADMSYTDPDGWTYFSDCVNRYLLLSLHANGQIIGTPVVSVGVAANYGSGGVPLHNADYHFPSTDDWWAINRYWNVSTTVQFANPVRVRFFYDQQDVQDLIASSGGMMTSFQEMDFYKVNGAGAHDLDVLAQGGSITKYGYSNQATTSTWTDSTYNGKTYAEFEVTEFSEGSAGWQGVSALPVEWTNFYGIGKEDKVVLFWETATEIDNDLFVLEKSNDGRSFTDFYQTESRGAGPNRYQAIDHRPYNGKNYYRIRQMDDNGAVDYSKVIVVDLEKKRDAIQLFPNPVSAALHFQLPKVLEGEISIRIVDKFGREIMLQRYESGNLASYEVDVQGLVSGHYVLRVDGKRYRSFTPFVIIGD